MGGHREQAFIRQQVITPQALNLNARAIDSAVNSNSFGTAGYNQLSLELFHDYAAGASVTFNLANIQVNGESTNPYLVQVGEDSSGTRTLSDLLVSKVTGADTRWVVNVPINAQNMQIRGLVATGSSTSSDLITVRAILSCL